MRHILVACDKFKGSLDAAEACAAIARGLARRWPDAVIERCPIADGGEGFAAALAVPLGGGWVTCESRDALDRPIAARYLLAESPDGPLAVMEMAEASGMWRIAPGERNILQAHTFGTGMMMRHAAEISGAARIVLGIGGSATNDGGAGMAAALGVDLLDEQAGALPPQPGILAERLARVDVTRRMPLPPVTAACDVASPLLGPTGATRVFGPQKGADETTIPVLERALGRLAQASGGGELAAVPGAGAAGGLGFGLLRFADARLVPGFDLLADLTGLEARIAAADLVITGEGSLDVQSLEGKGPVGIARLAKARGKAVWAFCGGADAAAGSCGLFDRMVELRATGLPFDELMTRAGELLERLAGPDGTAA